MRQHKKRGENYSMVLLERCVPGRLGAVIVENICCIDSFLMRTMECSTPDNFMKESRLWLVIGSSSHAIYRSLMTDLPHIHLLWFRCLGCWSGDLGRCSGAP
jgi:hypothetical protein